MIDSKIIITVDTEVGERAKYVKNGFEKFILGNINNEYYGLPKIVEILGQSNYKAEFFVDVYEYKYYGEKKFKNLCKFLTKNNHGVQLHTHPSYAYDTSRINMYEYSLEEQIKIISDGKELIKNWIGKYPIAHRAGNYGANNDTLQALKENKIKIDSSLFYKHENCKIQFPTKNDPIFYNGVLESPITVIKTYPKFLNIPIPSKKYWKKIDINWLNEKEIKKSILNLSKKHKYIILFLHSISFIATDYPRSITIDKAALKTFTNILDFFNKNQIKVISFKDLYKLHQK